ncbi:MAG: hypothetical protein HYZ73_08750, partial [Elusimicrobia bacterium]|nr:hypothetical protein [Elusimicrobiota bacterium]
PGGLSPTVIQVTVNRAHPASPPGPRIYFELPQGASDRDVRIVIVDQLGEREIYRQRHAPGSKIDLPVVLQGPGKARIFLDNTLILERPL